MFSVASCEQLVDQTKQKLANCKTKEDVKDVVRSLVQELIRKHGFHSQGEELKNIIHSLKPLTVGFRIRYDMLIKSVVDAAAESQTVLPTFWECISTHHEITDPYVRSLWQAFELAINEKNVNSMKASLEQMKALGIPIPPVIENIVQNMCDKSGPEASSETGGCDSADGAHRVSMGQSDLRSNRQSLPLRKTSSTWIGYRPKIPPTIPGKTAQRLGCSNR